MLSFEEKGVVIVSFFLGVYRGEYGLGVLIFSKWEELLVVLGNLGRFWDDIGRGRVCWV